MRRFGEITSKVIGRNCFLMEFSAAGSLFSTVVIALRLRERRNHLRWYCVTDRVKTKKSGRWNAKMRRAILRSSSTRSLIAPACTIAALLLIFSSSAIAQLPPLQSPPGWGQVPQGAGACSVEKSCADLAPGMIRSALGPSPLDQDARSLAAILSSRSKTASANVRAAAYAVDAFRRVGADRVFVEKFGQAAQFENVVAEIRGREKPKDYVLVAATLDGSGPNLRIAAENAAVLINAVRVIHNTGYIPRRSICFVLFGAGGASGKRFSGVWAYIDAHRDDLDRVAAALALGSVQGTLDGFSVEARPDTLPAIREAFEPLRTLGIRKFTQDVKIPTDVTPFWLEGIPAFVATGDPASAVADESSLARSAAPKLAELKRRVAVAAVAAYALADAETRMGPRQSRAQVRQTIKSMGLVGQLKRTGLWLQWLSAKSDASR
jgi:hypothetical protein